MNTKSLYVEGSTIVRPSTTYIRKDGLVVRAWANGSILSLVAYDSNGNAVDSWDGHYDGTPVRFLPKQ